MTRVWRSSGGNESAASTSSSCVFQWVTSFSAARYFEYACQLVLVEQTCKRSHAKLTTALACGELRRFDSLASCATSASFSVMGLVSSKVVLLW